MCVCVFRVNVRCLSGISLWSRSIFGSLVRTDGTQVDQFAEKMRNDSKLANGFNLVGYSQVSNLRSGVALFTWKREA